MDKYISTSEAAKITELSQAYIRGLCAKGRIASSKFGNFLMIERESLLAHMSAVKKWREQVRKKAGDPTEK